MKRRRKLVPKSNILYKFFDPSRASLLRDGKIRFSQIYALNDPFEGRPFFNLLAPDNELFSVLSNANDEETQEAAAQFMESLIDAMTDAFEPIRDLPGVDVAEIESVTNSLPSKEQVRNMVPQFFDQFVDETLIPQSKERMPELRPVLYNGINLTMGILCLTESIHNNLMWAHYAKNSQGFAVGFLKNHDYFNSVNIENPELNRLRRVEYSSKRPLAKYMMGLSLEDIVFTKPVDWEYEREWRIVKEFSGGKPLTHHSMPVIDDLGEIVYLFEFPPDIIQSIYFGSRMTDTTRSELFKVLDSSTYSHVDVYQARENERFYSLEFELIRHKAV